MSNPSNRSRLFLPVFLSALLGAALLYAWWQQKTISTLRAEAQASLALSEEVDRLRSENARIEEWRALAQEVERLRKDNTELNRLRNETRQLRAQVTVIEQLRAENQKLQGTAQQLLQQKQSAESQLAQATEEQAAAMTAKAQVESVQCLNQLKQIGLAGRMWASDHNDTFPPDFINMNQILTSPRPLVCPSDAGRTPADNWQQFQAANASYILVSPGIQIGDPAKVFVQCPVHGHLCLGDGSVQQARPTQ